MIQPSRETLRKQARLRKQAERRRDRNAGLKSVQVKVPVEHVKRLKTYAEQLTRQGKT